MKKSFFVFLSLMVCMTIFGGEVTQEQALKKARAFMKGKQIAPGKARQVSPGKRDDGNARNAFYVFNALNENGFVIISGDDRTREVLAYGDSGNLDTDNLPENVKWWLDSYTRQIEALGTSLKPAPKLVGDTQKDDINPLIKTQWDQSAPYNLMCPDGSYHEIGDNGYDASNLCVTGCVATAMAQVMNYWQWPETCPAIGSYTFKLNNIDRTVKGLETTTFKWNLMKNTYGDNETGDEAMAVAELMRYCGQAVHMMYTSSSSGASFSTGTLASVFQYSCNTRNMSRDGYTTSQWEAIVYDELSAGRPVLYSGQTSNNAGHEFIIDGYDKETGLFHFNWGWGGYLDSYYVLSLADPGSVQGIGGSNGAFQYQQTAMIGMKPAEGSEIMLPVFTSKMNSSTPEKAYTRSSTSDSFADVSLSGIVDVEYSMTSQSALTAEIGWALYKDDTFIKMLGGGQIYIPVIQQGYYNIYSNNLTVSFGADLPAGKYQLCQMYRLDNESEWALCDSYGTNFLYAEVTETSLTVRLPNLNVSLFEVNTITTSAYPEVGDVVSVKVNVTNTGESQNLSMALWTQKDGASSWSLSANSACILDPGMSGDVTLSFKPAESGTYNLKITSGDSEEALKTSSVIIASQVQIVQDGITYLCLPEYKRARIIQGDNSYRSTSSVTIPKTVTAGDVSCEVKAIDNDGFFNWSAIDKLVVPEGVETIGNEAFAYCFNLETLELPSSITSLGKIIIYCSSNLTTVITHATKPITVSEETFRYGKLNFETWEEESASLEATLYVPYGCKAVYEAAPYWNTFKEIVELPCAKGDVNGDNEVDIADAVCIVNYVVGKATPVFVASAADANGDGDIDIADAVSIVNLVVGKIPALARIKGMNMPEPE